MFPTQTQNNGPSLWLLKSEPTCTQTSREENKNTNVRISWISQYIEVKSEKILKIYQGIVRISPIYTKISITDNKRNIMHSTDWLLNIEMTQIDSMYKPNKLDHSCPLKWGNTRSNYLVHNIDILTITNWTDVQISRI